MKRLAALLLAPLLVGSGSGGSAEAASPISRESLVETLISTFHERCYSAEPTLDGFKSALSDVPRTAQADEAFVALAARERKPGAEIFSSGGLLTNPFPMVIRVKAYEPMEAPAEVITCEVMWSGDFPETLSAALGSKLGQPPRGPNPFQGSRVYEYGLPLSDSRDMMSLDATFLSEKQPLHSIARMVTWPRAIQGK